MATGAERLAREIKELRRRLEGLERAAATDLRSIEDGAIEEYDGDENLVQIVGQQYDGTHVAATVGGPKPPVPSTAIVEAVAGGLKITWDGEWVGALAAPMDFQRVDVHVQTDSTADPITIPPKTSIMSPRGNEVFIVLPEQTHYVTLVARALSGKFSDPSTMVSGTPIPPATGEGGSKIFRTDVEPVGLTSEDEGALWFDSGNGNRPNFWDGSAWVDARDAGIDAAQVAADAAQADANAAQATADGKIVTFFEPESNPPIADGVGDLWKVEDRGNLTRRWDGSQWVDLPSGQGSIDTAAVGRGEVEFNASGGMLSTIVPDPRFMDPAFRNLREKNYFGPGWNIVPVGNLLSSNEADWTINDARATSFVIEPGDEYEGALSLIIQADGVQSGEDLVVSNTFPVTPGVKYGSLALSPNANVDLRYEIDFMDPNNMVVTTYTCETSSGGFDHGAPDAATKGRLRVVGADSISTAYTGEAALYGVSTWFGGRDAKVGHYYATFEAQGTDNSTAWIAKNMPVEEEQELYLEIIVRPKAGAEKVQLNYVSWFNMADNRGALESTEVFYSSGLDWERLTTTITVPHGTQSMDTGLAAVPTALGQSAEIAQVILYPRGYRSKDGDNVAIFDPERLEFDHPLATMKANSGPEGIGPGEVLLRATDVSNTFISWLKLSRDGIEVTRPLTLVGETWRTVGDPGEPQWQNGYGHVNTSVDPVQFTKDASGNVWMRGRISTGTDNSTAFVLPAGYRPSSTMGGVTVGHDGGNAGLTCSIFDDGRVRFFGLGSASFVGAPTSFRI